MIFAEYSHDLDPYIPTEETMFKKLEENNYLSDDYVLCKLPLTHMINQLGVPETQNRINTFSKTINEFHPKTRKVFICQHILTERLRFDENSIVCTPHATVEDDYISIPHYPVNVDRSKIKNDKEMIFSFLGSIETHQTRRGLTILYKQNCFDSKVHWGLDHEHQADKDFTGKYIEMLGNSKFSLCPRGTGISSVRLFESMAMGAIPVIIANGYKPPLHHVIKWNSISIIIPENRINKIGQILASNYTDDHIKKMSEKVISIYDEYLSPENFSKSIELGIEAIYNVEAN